MLRRAAPRFEAVERYLFDLQGYILFENVLDPRLTERLLGLIQAQGVPPAGADLMSQRFGGQGKLFRWGREFCDLLDHPLVVEVLQALIGSSVRLDHAYGIAMSPGTAGLGLHGPAQPWDPAQYYTAPMGVPRSGLLSFSWALTGGLPGQGGFGAIPGSHRASLPVPPGADSLAVEVPQPAGSLLVFTEGLVHQTIPWHGTDTRWVVIYKYSPGSSAWDPSAPADPETIAGMSQRQQRFFQPPSVGGRIPTL